MRRLRRFTVKVQAARRKFNRNRQKLDASTQTVREALIVNLENAFEFAMSRMRATKNEKNKYATKIFVGMKRALDTTKDSIVDSKKDRDTRLRLRNRNKGY